MKGLLILIDNEHSSFKYDFQIGIEPFDYEITINTDLSENYEDILLNSYLIDESINFNIKYVKETEHDSKILESNIKIYESAKNKSISLIQNVEYIQFYFSYDKVANFLNKNIILKNKKIILEEDNELDLEMLKRIKEAFNNETSNIFFKLKYNEELINYEECFNTFDKINSMIKDINSFNFSPIEKVMYIYDLVRGRIYNKEGINETQTISRNLTSSLLGDKIVCAGFAKIFNILLYKIGIDSRIVRLIGSNSAHARNEIYIKDDKYDINGVYYFDTTWDSKKNKKDNLYLLSYRNFAKTRSEMDYIDKKRYRNVNFPFYSNDMHYILEDYLETENYSNIPEDLLHSINYMSRIINKEDLIEYTHTMKALSYYGHIDKNKILEIEKLVDHFDRPIYADKLLKVLLNVRKIEYYINPDKYSFSKDDLAKIVTLSGWTFDETPDERILNTFGIIHKASLLRSYKYISDKNIDKDIERIKVAKVLRKVYERRK